MHENLQTLLLNADATPKSIIPLSVLSWKDAIKSVHEGVVEILAEYDVEVHSPSITMKVPSIVMLREYVKKNRSINQSKAALVKLRDMYHCQYCGLDCSNDHDELTMDHVIPRKLGGKSSWENLVSACKKCNGLKGSDTIMKPRVMPIKPTIGMLEANKRKCPIMMHAKEWQDYLQWDEKMIIYIDHA